jgi:hypothetical protein
MQPGAVLGREHRDDEAREPGADAKVEAGAVRWDQASELGAVGEVPSPDRVEAIGRNKIDRSLPFAQKIRIGFKLFEVIRRNVKPGLKSLSLTNWRAGDTVHAERFCGVLRK